MLSAIIYGNYNKYSIIDSNSLDESNKKILNFLNQQYDLDVVIIDITGHLGIPTIMVYERNNQYGKETLLTGFGTSNNVEYAIERALLEYKQTIDLVIYDNTLPKEDNYLDYLEKNKINDFFKKIYYFDRKVLENIPVKKLQVIEENCKNQLKIVNVNKMLIYILRILKEFGYEVYYYDKKMKLNFKQYIYYVKVIIPQMSDITDPGTLRLPNKRMILRVKQELTEC